MLGELSLRHAPMNPSVVSGIERFKIVGVLALMSISYAAAAKIPGLEPEKSWDLSGYVKYMATVALPDDGEDSVDHLIHQRFNYEYRFSRGFRFNVGMRNRVMLGDSASLDDYDDFVSYDSGYMDLSKNWVSNDDLIVNSQLDRVYLDWKGKEWNSRVGRFRINWAMNTVWNPNDVFNSYSIYDFDYEERPGSDALLVGKKLGFADGVELVFSPNHDRKLNSYSMRYYANNHGWDYQFIAGKSQDDAVLGFGFATDLKGAGIRGEVSWFDPRNKVYDQQEATFVASVEADYNFGGKQNWVSRIAWLALENPMEVDNAKRYLNLPLSAKTLSFTQHTGYVDVSFDITPLNRLTMSASGYDDHSYFVGLSNSYSVANNWQLLTVLQRFDGASDSLFGAQPSTLVYVNVKWSF